MNIRFYILLAYKLKIKLLWVKKNGNSAGIALVQYVYHQINSQVSNFVTNSEKGEPKFHSNLK
jgi:antitoxin component of MazEF toxin-antitoxin module